MNKIVKKSSNKKSNVKVKERPTKVKTEKTKKALWKTILSIILMGAIALVSLFLVFALYIVISSPDLDKKELQCSKTAL